MQVRDIDDPRENIFGGVRLLRILANEFNGDLELTIAAYNAGDGAVIRFGGIPPFQQTRDYVVSVTRYYRRYRTMPDIGRGELSRGLIQLEARLDPVERLLVASISAFGPPVSTMKRREPPQRKQLLGCTKTRSV